MYMKFFITRWNGSAGNLASSARYYLVFIVVVNSRVEASFPSISLYTFTSETELPKLVQKVQCAFGLWHDLQNSNTYTDFTKPQVRVSIYVYKKKHSFSKSFNFMSFYCLRFLIRILFSKSAVTFCFIGLIREILILFKKLIKNKRKGFIKRQSLKCIHP